MCCFLKCGAQVQVVMSHPLKLSYGMESSSSPIFHTSFRKHHEHLHPSGLQTKDSDSIDHELQQIPDQEWVVKSANLPPVFLPLPSWCAWSGNSQGLPSVVVTHHTVQLGLKYEIAFLSIAKEFARAEIGFASPAGSVVLKVFKFKYHHNTSFGSQPLTCMNMITRILTSNCTIVEKRHAWNKNTFVLGQCFGVNSSYEYHKCAQGYHRKNVALVPYGVTFVILLQMQQKLHSPKCKYYSLDLVLLQHALCKSTEDVIKYPNCGA